MGATEKPLAGRRIVVTRAPKQAAALVRELEALGAEVVRLPTVAFRESADSTALDGAIHSLAEFDWLLFTSQNAVRFFSTRCEAVEEAEAARKKLQVAAVGPATAAAARERGWRVDYVAVEHRGAVLAGELRSELAGKRVLLPRSNRAGDELPAALREAGAAVSDVVAYENVRAEGEEAALEALLGQPPDAVTFASPSAFHHFAELAGEVELKRLTERAALAAIGPTTATAIREAGFPVAVVAAESTSAGLAAALVEYLSARAARGAVRR